MTSDTALPVELDALAALLWKAEAEGVGAPPSIADRRTAEAFADASETTKATWRKFARVALSPTRTETHHLCGHCEMGSYEGQVELAPPDFLRRSDGRGICVDVCLALEISQLWRSGIKTTGCCCGHGKPLAYIGVIPEHIGRMKEMGYEVSFNPSRPGDEDSFVPKTPLSTTEGE